MLWCSFEHTQRWNNSSQELRDEETLKLRDEVNAGQRVHDKIVDYKICFIFHRYIHHNAYLL